MICAVSVSTRAGGYIKAVREALANAHIVFDRFHVARLATDAIDEVRRAFMRQLHPEDRRDLRRCRWVLLKRPDAHASHERAKLQQVRRLNDALYRAYSGLTNARLEGMNNKIRLLSHRAYGFHSAEPLIATIYLCCSKIRLPDFQLA